MRTTHLLHTGHFLASVNSRCTKRRCGYAQQWFVFDTRNPLGDQWPIYQVSAQSGRTFSRYIMGFVICAVCALSPLSPPPHHTPAMGPPHGGNIPAHLVPAIPAHSLSMVFCETPGSARMNLLFLCHGSYSTTLVILMRIKMHIYAYINILSHINSEVIAYKVAAQRTFMITHDFMFSQSVCLSVSIFLLSLHTTNTDRHSWFHMTWFHSL